MSSQSKSNESLLAFGEGNAKLGKSTFTFTLPAGVTCPGAEQCLAHVDPHTNKLKDGPKQQFRCFAASTEVAYTTLRNRVRANLSALAAAKTVEAKTILITSSLAAAERRAGAAPERVRVHVGGDFYSEDYFVAWMMAAAKWPETVFYAYTKSIPTWVKYRNIVPENFVLTASVGGKYDHLIDEYQLRHAVVVFHRSEAEAMGIPVDKSDDCAANPSLTKFALQIHGMQPKGSAAAAAIKQAKADKTHHSYSRKRKPKSEQISTAEYASAINTEIPAPI